MATHQFSASRVILAPPHDLYAVIADYNQGHKQILPKPPFVSLDVEQGGTGAGTVIRATMRVFGQKQTFRSVVSEPEPGRVLVETNDNGYVTTFTVSPYAGGESAEVTIATVITRRIKLLGAIETWFMARLLRPVYVRELAQLAQVAAARSVEGNKNSA